MLALYTVPLIGVIVFNLLGVLALGTVVYTLILATQRRLPTTAAPAAPGAAEPVSAAPPPASPARGAASAAQGPDPAHTEAPANAPATPAAAPLPLSWPRAGFWIRMGALLIDVIIVSVVWHLLDGHDGDRHSLPMLLLAGYGAVMWILKVTTV